MLKKIIKSYWFDYVLIMILGVAIFGIIYGFRVVVPTYTSWLLAGGGDLSQEYLGWKAFRVDDWRFPLGLINNISYPSSTSVMYADPIPCLAIFFKIFRPFLPEEFQYLGIWGVVCFVLMGVFSYRILSKYTDNRLHRLLCAIFFMFSPTIILKMYGHTPLAGQWIILFAIDSCLTFNRNRNIKSMVIKIFVLGYLGVSVHMYFIMFSGIILAGECLYDILNTKKIKLSILFLIEYCVVGFITLLILGAFHGSVSASGGGLGIYSFNLNGLINPQGFSKILKDLPLYGFGQYEGMAYLGVGMIFLSVLCLVMCITEGNLKERLKSHWRQIISICAVAIVTYIVSASNVLTVNDKVIFKIDLPNIIFKAWSMFRASGRLAWILSYTIMILTLVYCCYRIKNKRLITGLLLICLFIQIYDLSDIIKYKNYYFSKNIKYISTIYENIDSINYFEDNAEIEHIVLAEAWYDIDLQNLYDISIWAIDNNKTMSTFYFARDINEEVANNLNESLSHPSKNELFICTKNHALKFTDTNLYCYDAGDYVLGYFESIDGLEETTLYSEYEFGKDIVVYNTESYNADQYIKSGISTKEENYSWTNENEMIMGMLLNSNSAQIHGQIDIANVYNNTQKVQIYVNEICVFDDDVSYNQGQLDFYFDNPGYGNVVEIKFEFPECDSPLNRGESSDSRMLCLGIKNIRFMEIYDYKRDVFGKE